MLIWHTSCNLFGTLFGSPFGTPFSTLFGITFSTPFYSPFGTPFCSPLGTPFSSPFGTPLRRLLGTLFCRPLGASLLQSVWYAVFPIWLLFNILSWHLFARLLIPPLWHWIYHIAHYWLSHGEQSKMQGEEKANAEYEGEKYTVRPTCVKG